MAGDIQPKSSWSSLIQDKPDTASISNNIMVHTCSIDKSWPYTPSQLNEII